MIRKSGPDGKPPPIIMDPVDVIIWAVCIGVGWLIFSSLTGADDWLRSRFGKANTRDLEKRVAALEKRLDEIDKK